MLSDAIEVARAAWNAAPDTRTRRAARNRLDRLIEAEIVKRYDVVLRAAVHTERTRLAALLPPSQESR